jgi:TRAP-type C4-dicarboxylate transport system permease large subunit
MTSTTADATPTFQVPLSLRLPFRLERAELLKLRKRRGVAIPTVLLTVGAMVVMYLVLELFHLSNSTKYGPAGGTSNFSHAVFMLGQLAGMIGAALVGAAAGTEDLGAGVFRELVATGRSRTRLFLARIPGGLVLLLPLVAAAYAIAAVLSVALAGGRSTPGIGLYAREGLWVLLAASVIYAVALGLGSLVGSRAATISILLAYLLPVQAILRSISALGRSRDALVSAAVDRVAPVVPSDRANQVHMSLGVAILSMSIWVGVALGLGLWRTQTRDA